MKWEEYIREKCGVPLDWNWYRATATGMHPKVKDGPPGFIRVDGGVAPLREKGPRRGRPNWKLEDKSKATTHWLKIEDVENWELEQESKTGKCKNCDGTGKRCNGFDQSGSTYEPCQRCNATGKPPIPEINPL